MAVTRKPFGIYGKTFLVAGYERQCELQCLAIRQRSGRRNSGP
jgi:hypothetical protein